MPLRFASLALVSAVLLLPGLAAPVASAQNPDKNVQIPLAGPRATSLRQTPLYVAPDTSSQKLDRVVEGRELVIAETSGPWIRVFANTDQEEVDDRDKPVFGSDEVPPPITGWMQAKGVVQQTTPGGDLILMGEAERLETLAEDVRGPRNAGQSARYLYRRLVDFFPSSKLAPEAAWRAADIRWQFEKADAATRPSARERDPYLREQLYEDEMRKIIKTWPDSRQADLAAYELIDNKLCGDWQGSEKCPVKESAAYESFVKDFPDGPRTAQAMYQIVYRQAALGDMLATDDNQKKADVARARAKAVAADLEKRFPTSDAASRAAAIVFKIEQGLAVYGIDQD